LQTPTHPPRELVREALVLRTSCRNTIHHLTHVRQVSNTLTLSDNVLLIEVFATVGGVLLALDELGLSALFDHAVSKGTHGVLSSSPTS